jgi:hypothetical protein
MHIAIEYRLAPENVFPCPIHDLLSAYLSLIDPPADSGMPKYHPSQITFVGDSAGGNLALVTGLWIRDQIAQGNTSIPLPAGLGLLCPWMDMSHSMPSFVLNGAHDFLPSKSHDPNFINETRSHYYLPHNMHLDNPLVSPIYAKEKLGGVSMPPMLIQVGGAERLRDESIYFYAETMKTERIQLEIFEDMVHDWHLFAVAEPVARTAIQRVADFILNVTPDRKEGESEAQAEGTSPEEMIFERHCRHIRNQPGFPAQVFEDPQEYLQAQVNHLKDHFEDYPGLFKLTEAQQARLDEMEAAKHAAAMETSETATASTFAVAEVDASTSSASAPVAELAVDQTEQPSSVVASSQASEIVDVTTTTTTITATTTTSNSVVEEVASKLEAIAFEVKEDKVGEVKKEETVNNVEAPASVVA